MDAVLSADVDDAPMRQRQYTAPVHVPSAKAPHALRETLPAICPQMVSDPAHGLGIRSALVASYRLCFGIAPTTREDADSQRIAVDRGGQLNLGRPHHQMMGLAFQRANEYSPIID